MKKSLIFVPIALALAAVPTVPAVQSLLQNPSEQSNTATKPVFETVTRVVDGDTVLLAADWSPYDLEWKVRILGIDTPEKGHLAHCEREQKLSKKAQALTESLLGESLMRVRLKSVKHDKYGGRLDAEVILADGRSLGDELIKSGLARPYTGDGPKPNWCRP